MNQLTKKYGLLTAIAMVVGIVIGSGVFFKADDVLIKSGGNMLIGLAAWIIGAIGMIFGAQVFGQFAQRFEKSNGIVDYTEALLGEKAGYLAGWFIGILYYTPLTAVLSWVSAMYTAGLFKVDNPATGMLTWGLTLFYLVLLYVLNIFSPIIAWKLQVSTMFIKLIPLGLIAVVGTIAGLMNGVVVENIQLATNTVSSSFGTLATAVVATAFAYEGWIIAVSINEEIIDAKRNLPKALIFGTLIVFIVYVAYFLGINSVLSTEAIIAQGDLAASNAATALFGSKAAVLLDVFVVISCLGTANGLVLVSSRSMYSLAVRNQGPMPQTFSKIDDRTGMPIPSAIFGFILTLAYVGIWYGNFNGLFGSKFIDISELPIVLIYVLYSLLYVTAMIKLKDLSFMKRFVIPSLAVIGSAFVITGGIMNDNISYYLVISFAIVLLGLVFYRSTKVSIAE